MSHHAEPMDVDCMDTDFDNKENTFRHGNVPCTEKGYEELDVSELNMKLRYSVTPVSSPMSKSFTACPDNRHFDSDNGSGENANLTRSLNSAMTKNDSVIKSLKGLPLQSLCTDQFADGNGNASVRRQLDSSIADGTNVTVTITGTNADENVSLPSSSSSALHTPEATTPTKEIKDTASPIMRGLKSVFNIFRSSQSPVPPMEGDNIKQEVLSPAEVLVRENAMPHVVASTPIATHRARDGSFSKRSSPYKDSITFNDDMEKELNWTDDTTFAPGTEKIPIHKMLLQNSKSFSGNITMESDMNDCNVDISSNTSVEYMDMSNNDTIVENKTMTELQPNSKHECSVAAESDSEFVDCETTLSKNESYVLNIKSVQEKLAVNETRLSKNESYVLDIKTVQEKLSPNIKILSNIVNIPCATENMQTFDHKAQADYTSVSFTDLDFNNDGDKTMPSDYSDYSQCTVDILSELEKVEANISSETDIKINQSDTDKGVPEQVDAHKVVTNIVTFEEENKPVSDNQAKESPDNVCQQEEQKETSENVEKEAKFTSTEEKMFDGPPKVVVALEAVMDTIHLSESEKKDSHQAQEIQASPTEEHSIGECNIKVDPCLQSTNYEQEILEPTVLDSTKTENQSVELIPQDSTNIIVGVLKNIVDIVSPEISHLLHNNVNSIDTTNVIQTDVPLEISKSSQNEAVPAVDFKDTQSLKSINIALPVKVDESVLKLNEFSTVESNITKNPSDIPLPDDDDIEKEGEISVVTVVLDEAAPAFTPKTSDMAVTLSETKVIEVNPKSVENKFSDDTILTFDSSISPQFEPENSASINTKLCDERTLEPLSKNETGDEKVVPKIDSMSDKSCSQLAHESTNTTTGDSELNAMKNIDDKFNDALPENNVGLSYIMPEIVPSLNSETKDSEILHKNIIPELDGSSPYSGSQLDLEPEKISTEDLALNATKIVDETCNIDDGIVMPEVATSSNEVTNQTVNNVAGSVTEIIDTFQQVSSAFNVTVTKENLLPELDVSLQSSSQLAHETTNITMYDSQSNATKILNDKCNETLPTCNIDSSNAMPEVVPSSNDVIKQLVGDVAGNVSHTIEDCQQFTNILDVNVTKEIVLPALDNVCLQSSLLLADESTKIATTDSELNITTFSDEVACNDASPANNTDPSVIMPEVVVLSNVTNQTSDDIAGSQIIDNSQQNITITKENLEHVQKEAQDEPMDISMNKSLNHTHDLSDLVNQTIIMSDAPVDESKQDQTVTLTEGKCVENLELTQSASDILERSSDFKVIPEYEKSITLKENVTDFPTVNYKSPIRSESIQHNTIVADTPEKMTESYEHDQPPKIFTNAPISDLMEVEEITVDEEIIVSANNSPYVSLMSSVEKAKEIIEDTFEQIESPFDTKTNVASSPPIVSKGYNFNFDEINDPFATKTKIRLSPPLDTPTKPIQSDDKKDKEFKAPNKGVANRRKSQPVERNKPARQKKFNSSFDAKSTSTTSLKTKDDILVLGDVKVKKTTVSDSETLEIEQKVSESVTDKTIEHVETNQSLKDSILENKNKVESRIKENMPEPAANPSENFLDHIADKESESSIDSVTAVSNDIKATSSSELSTYYSAGTSSTESFQSKNVFNLPEIGDVNFNPFATKSKMRLSPPPYTEINNPFATITKLKSSADVSPTITGKLEMNRTITFDESNLTNVAKDIDHENKIETELMEKDTLANTTGTTSSSKCSDEQNLTTREVNTEDEDTIEGPFLDAGDYVEKITDFAADNNDMMQFNDLRHAAQENEDNLDGEIFIDAEAFEFLLNQNKTNVVANSGKESLFLKFDPLFAKRVSSDGMLATLSKVEKKQSTPTKPTRPSLRNEASPIAGPSAFNVTCEGDNNCSLDSFEDANITVTKPMMVVTPAFNPAVTPRNKSITPNRSNRRSVTFTSPAIAVIDRLLSMSANNSALGVNTTFTQSSGEQNEADLALTQLRDLLAEKEISVYNLRCESKELKDRLATMETQVKNLEIDGQLRLKKINELNERIAEKTKMNKSMAAVVEEYERTIASLIADIEQDKKRNAEEKIRLINERDEQTAHLTSMEVSFSDLHSKYEKSKQVILTMKTNEDTYKKSLKEFEEQVAKMQANYETLKQHATAKLNHANQELDKINRAHEAEVLKLNAMIKRNQLLATSLQESLAQKTKANDELTAICDELINKVG